MTEHNADLSKLLSLDKTITSQLNLSSVLQEASQAVSKATLPFSQSQVFLLLPGTSVTRALEIGNNPLFYRAR